MSGDGGGDPQTTTQSTTQELSPEQRAILEPLVPIVSEFGQTPIQQFPGTTVPGFTPTEQTAQQQALTAAGGIEQDVGQANTFANFLQSQAFLPGANPALQANIDAAVRPLTETFGQTVLPQIRGQENLAGQVGGSRGGLAEQQATNALLRQVGETSSGLINANFQNALKAGGQSLFAQPNLATSALLPSEIASGVGGAERALQTAQLQEEAQKFGAEQLAAFAPAQAAANLAFGFPGGTTTSVNTSPGPQGISSTQGALGGASIGALFGPWGAAVGGGLGALAPLLLG